MTQPLVVGIAGGTASGKTTVTRKIREALAGCRVAFIDQDSYYKDLADLPLEERREINFDHPDAFDTELMVRHLRTLKARPADPEAGLQLRDLHARRPSTVPVQPGEI